jgi:hypothetical protein
MASETNNGQSTSASAEVDPLAPGAEFEHEFEPSPEFQKVVQAPQENEQTFDVTRAETVDFKELIRQYREANLRLVRKLQSGKQPPD